MDNGSDPGHDRGEIVSHFGQARMIHEPLPGSYAARNQGLSQARGNIVAFTDADCIPNPDWIEKGVRTLQKFPECGLVAGKFGT